MNLLQLTEQYLAERELAAQYAAQIRHRIGNLVKACGITEANQLDYIICNQWLQQISERAKPPTVLGYRAALLAIWRYAADLDYCKEPVCRRVRRPRKQARVVEAWTTGEISRLYQACHSDHFRLYVCVAYDTGLRRSDCLSLPTVSQKPFIVIEHKTRRPRVVAVREYTHQLWLEYGPLRWKKTTRTWFHEAKALVARAGLRGSMKNLRRSHGSYVGTLGHLCPSVFEDHYHDLRLQAQVELPPPLF